MEGKIRQRKPDKTNSKNEDQDRGEASHKEPQSKLSIGLCTCCCSISLLPWTFLVLYLYFTPYPINPVATVISEKYPEMPPEDKIKRIQSPERLRMFGAECFAVHEASGQVYTAIASGAIARFGLDLSEPKLLLRTGTCVEFGAFEGAFL